MEPYGFNNEFEFLVASKFAEADLNISPLGGEQISQKLAENFEFN